MIVCGIYVADCGDGRVDVLRSRLAAANAAADEAMAAYDRVTAILRQRHRGDRVGLRIAKRDDLELADHAAAAAFYTSLATRLATTLTVELLFAGTRDHRHRWRHESDRRRLPDILAGYDYDDEAIVDDYEPWDEAEAERSLLAHEAWYEAGRDD